MGDWPSERKMATKKRWKIYQEKSCFDLLIIHNEEESCVSLEQLKNRIIEEESSDNTQCIIINPHSTSPSILPQLISRVTLNDGPVLIFHTEHPSLCPASPSHSQALYSVTHRSLTFELALCVRIDENRIRGDLNRSSQAVDLLLVFIPASQIHPPAWSVPQWSPGGEFRTSFNEIKWLNIPPNAMPRFRDEPVRWSIGWLVVDVDHVIPPD